MRRHFPPVPVILESKFRYIVLWVMTAISLITTSYVVRAAPVRPSESKRDRVIRLVVQIQRADYEGDRRSLQRLYQDLAPFVEDKKLGAKVRYWRGFAMWRRAINGFNDSADPQELERDIKNALGEFEASFAKDPAFVDAKVAAGSSMGLLMFLYRQNPTLTTEFKDPARVRDFFIKALSYQKEAEAAEPENPRVLWVLGQTRWVLPAERGGGQDKAFETYNKGLEIVRRRKAITRDPLMPSWGEPELMMNLAWSNLNRKTPDLVAAEQYARSALALVPYWHYVKDILLPQIEAAKAKKE
jgi:hypothetical protein